MVYIIALSVIAGALGLYYFLFKDLNYFKKYGIPHKTPLPIVGNMGPTFLRLQSITGLVKTTYNLHPEAKYVGMFDMNVPIVVIRDPELIKSIALKHFDNFMDHRSFIDENQDPLFGRNLFALRGEKWRQVRSLLSPAFTSSKMKNMFKLMSDCGANFGNYLAQLPPEQRILEMKDVFTRYTNDVIATCAFGVSVDSTKNPKNEFYIYGKEATVFSTFSFIKFYIFRSLPWLARLINLKVIRQKITDFFRDLIETTIKARDENGIVRPDMLQLMMETRGKEGKAELSTDDMVAQAFVFFFAGFDSTSTRLLITFFEFSVVCVRVYVHCVNTINIMIYVIVLLIAGTLSLYYLLFKDLNYFKKHGIPYVKPLPIVGSMKSTFLRRESIPDFIKSVYNLFPDAKYIGLYDVKNPIIMLRDPELIKSVTLKHFDMFMDHISFVDENQDPVFGKNLAALRGERWREIRSILSPAFTSSKMKTMYKLMFDCGVDFGSYLAQLPPEERIMEIKDVFTRFTNDVIATCAFGVKVDSMRNRKNDFYVYGTEATNFTGNLIFLKMYILRTLPWLARILKLTFVREEIANFFRELVKITIKARDENGIVRPDMLQLMMESRGKDGKTELTIDDMVSQAFIFFFGGFESTSTLMCFAAHEIAINQNIHKRLQNEIDQVLEDTNGQATYEAVNSMEYLDAIINEALRMYPVVVMLDRLCLKDFELPPPLPGIKPFTIKKGHGIWVPVYGLHRDPKYFEEPEKFDPERFLGERKKDNFNCGAYLPFGIGPRMCIGNRFALLETKVLLFQLLARCDLKPCKKTSVPIKITKNSLFMKPEGGFWLSVMPRKNTHHSITANDINGTG
ncbi:Cytochrome P450 9e2 [Trachymyrmex cornetzi]|uniref:Cytochrome P450 9e2 n=2 Tax=Trachymyrmex cornetzi TaxID=471704 RepID=A0A195DB32_9HYME|nr:Cytochrome P450 9e2 [Trachymyrmex cornetzi]